MTPSIYVVVAGRIVESGTCDELAHARSGVYGLMHSALAGAE